MMTTILRKLRVLRLIASASFSVALSACQMCTISKTCADDEECRGHAKVCHNPTVMNLARDLDHLENHIEWNGSVVIQKPSVWGQARLMKYRTEFEDVMAPAKDTFQETLQGRMQRDDQAFFVQAMALGIAASGPGAVTQYPAGTLPTPTSSTAQSTNVVLAPPTQDFVFGVGKLKADGTVDPASIDLAKGQAFAPPRPGTAAKFVKSVGTGDTAALQISLEPTIVLEQKARYLNYLNQIRRTNEGDDTADSPGYALHVMRIPVSVLPGKHTQKGHGAEVTLSIEPVLGDELLPMTFRNLVINDVVDQIGFPLTKILNERDVRDEFLNECTEKAIHKIKDAENCPAPPTDIKSTKGTAHSTSKQLAWQSYRGELASGKQTAPPGTLMAGFKANLSHSRMRNADLPMPASQLFEVYGIDNAFQIGYEAKHAFEKEFAREGIIHLSDVQSYLDEQLAAAYKFLSKQSNEEYLWAHCTPALAMAVHARDWRQLATLRTNFQKSVRHKLGEVNDYSTLEKVRQSRVHSTTAALAWAILVEAALLNDKLVQDMKETSSARQMALNTEWLDYFSPTPSANARQAFSEYVKTRWPVHVFALDPESQDQNIADSFTRRREMQLAMSLAFVNGQINARSLTRYARRLDSEYDTIALNRTSIGFSHGEDTFGWRFYPRFQTPDTDNNLTVLLRDQLIGGPNKDHDLAQCKLEPGIRTCVAIVVMPAFVPYVEITSTSNYFSLTNPKHKVMDNTNAMRLSRSVRTIQNCSNNVRDADCYRDGDYLRLLKKANQLAARLPMQTAQSLVPYENTLGGFQLFSTGVTDLAPELIGWYGAPGIQLDSSSTTTLFLVGDHFNVKQTRVIAGGVDVSSVGGNVELLSRQVMKVTIPGRCQAEAGMVKVRVATPYGVTNVLEVKAVMQAPVRNEFSWVPEPAPKAVAKITVAKDGTTSVADFSFEPAQQKYDIVDNVVHAKEYPPLQKAKLNLKVAVFVNDKPRYSDEIQDIPVDFKATGRARDVDLAAQPKFKEFVQKAWNAKDKVGDTIRLDVAGFIGVPDVGSGISFAVVPRFQIIATTFSAMTTTAAPEPPANYSPRFGRPVAIVVDDPLPPRDTVVARPDR